MKNKLIMLGLVSLMSVGTVSAQDFGTKADADKMLKAAVASAKSNKLVLFDEINKQDPKWRYKDIYPVAFALNGEVLAHATQPKLVGKDFSGMKDPDGKEFIKDGISMANTKNVFSVQYRYTDPVTKKVLPKELFCERLDDYLVCVGIYKR